MARQRLCLGIDIGASGVRLCSLRAGRAGFVVEHFAQAPLPPETLVDGTLMAAPRVVAALQSLLQGYRLPHRRAAVALSGRVATLHTLSVTKMDRDSLEAQLPAALGAALPAPPAELYLDLQILGDSAQAPDQMDVLAVAAAKAPVDDLCAVLAAVGLQAEICDIDAFATQNFFEATHGVPEAHAVALCSVGASASYVNVVQHGRSLRHRPLDWGADRLTQQIQRFYNLPHAEAEQIKCTRRVLPEALETDLNRVTEELAQALRAALADHAAGQQARLPSCLYLCGGGANDPRILAGLTQVLALPVRPFDLGPLQVPAALSPALAQAGLGAATCAGLALRQVGDG